MRPRVWTSLILSAGVLAAAAGAVAQQQRPTAERRAAAKPAAKQPSLLDRLTNMVNQPDKPAEPPRADPSAPQPLVVDWTASKRYAENGNGRGGRVTAGFVAKNRGAIDSLSVPVLLPGDPDLVAGLRLFSHGDFYTVSTTAHGMTFLMTGHSRAYPLPPGAAKGLGRGGLAGRIPADGVVIEGNENGLNADFTRFGAVYSIALDCKDRLADPRCGSDAYVRGVIARMTVVTPAGRG